MKLKDVWMCMHREGCGRIDNKIKNSTSKCTRANKIMLGVSFFTININIGHEFYSCFIHEYSE